MKKQKSDIAVLLDFAGSYKALTFLGLGAIWSGNH